MPTVTSPSVATARTVDAPPAGPQTDPVIDPHADPAHADPDLAEATLDQPQTAARPTPTRGTGVRNGLVRTRTVRSNSFRALLKIREDRGAATAEYIVATMAAVGFAGLLIVILRGDEVRGILTELVRSALTVG